MTLRERIERHDAAHAWLREIVLPVEELASFTSAPSPSGYRWFRSDNVIDLATVRAIMRN
jgi:hypothetical protein